MAQYTKQQLISASNATYFTNVNGGISASAVRDLNDSWISSSALLSGSNTFIGNQIISGNLDISGTITASLQTGYLYVGDSSGKTQAVATSSIIANTNTGSLLVTASFASTNITFTKGDASTFNLPGFATTGSNTFTGNQTLVSSSISFNGSGNITLPNGFSLTANAGDVANLSATSTVQFITEPPAGPGGEGNSIKFINRVSGSFIQFDNQQAGVGNPINFIGGASQFTLTVASGSTGKLNINAAGGIDASNSTFTASLANGFTYVGNSSNVSTLVATSSFGTSINTGSFATTGSNTFRGNQNLDGKLTISGSDTNQIFFERQGGGDILRLGVSQNGNTFELGLTGSVNKTMWLIDNLGGVRVNTFDAPIVGTSYLSLQGALTASLQQGYAWVGNSSNVSTLVATSSFGTSIDTGSFATTGSNTFTGVNTFNERTNLQGINVYTGSASGIYIGDRTNFAPTTAGNIPGNQHTVVGQGALNSFGNGDLNAAFGPNALYLLISGSSNLAMGGFAGYALVNGNTNTFIGDQAGNGMKGGDNNFFLGSSAGNNFRTGSYNIMIGLNTAGNLATGSGNLFIGTQTGTLIENNVDNQLSIKYGTDLSPRRLLYKSGSEAANLYLYGGLEIENSLTASLAQGYAWVGDSNNRTTLVATSSFGSGGTIDTGSFLTTGSYNTSQNVRGAINFYPTGSTSGYAIQIFNTGSDASGSMRLGVTDPGNPFIQLKGQPWFQFGTGNQLQFQSFTSSYDNGIIIGPYYTASEKVHLMPRSSSLQFSQDIGSGEVPIFTLGTYNGVSQSIFEKDLRVKGQFTASLQQGYAWVGNASGISTLVATSSFGGGGTTYINPTLNPYSGSLILVANTFTSSSFAHISASANGQVNLVFKNNNNTVDTILSGSGNIFTNANPVATGGMKRYIGGSGNIALRPDNIPQITGSMTFSPTMNNNYFGNNAATNTPAVTMRGPVSSSAWTISANNILGQLNIGNNTGFRADKLTGGLTITGNSINGSLLFSVDQSALTGSTTSVTNNIFAGATTLYLSSSAVAMSNNIINDNAFTFTNQFYSSSLGLGSVAMNRNNIGGQTNSIIISGSLPAGTTTSPSLSDNFIFGGANTIYIDVANARVSGSTAYYAAVRNGLMGNNLIVSGSSLLTDASSYGSVFVGRYNADDNRRNKTSDTVFAVGTGNTTTRKTGFLIDSGSNSYFEGTLNVSGSTAMNGNQDITGSLLVSSFTTLASVSSSLNFADDTAAAAGGVPLGGLYRNGNFVMIRLT